jgi:hypothetical protein
MDFAGQELREDIAFVCDQVQQPDPTVIEAPVLTVTSCSESLDGSRRALCEQDELQ